MLRLADRTIVVPTDFSEEPTAALDQAMELASRPELVAVIHVAPPMAAFEPAFINHEFDDSEREANLHAAFKQRYSDAKYKGARFEVRFGDPGREIAGFAREEKAALIIMPSHGRTGLAHLLIGSVAEHVVRYASCPVLVLRKGHE